MAPCTAWALAATAAAASLARDLATAAASDGSVWVFTSSQAIAHLKQLLPDVLWKAAKAIATHDRIAQAAVQLGVGNVVVCKPALSELLSSLESLA